MARKTTNNRSSSAKSARGKSAKAAALHPRQAQERSKAQRRGRLVRNHSTHLPNLIAVLERLCRAPGIETLTPAVIGRARSHAPHFRLKVSVPTQGGFKLIARQGKSFQEVFVTTHLDKTDLEAAIQTSLGS